MCPVLDTLLPTTSVAAGIGWPARLKDLALCKSVLVYPSVGDEEYWTHVLQNGTHLIRAHEITEETRGKELLDIQAALEADPIGAQKLAEAGTDILRRILHPSNIRRRDSLNPMTPAGYYANCKG